MRWRPLFWLCVSMFCFGAALYFWRLGDEWAAEKAGAPRTATNGANPAAAPSNPPAHSQATPIPLLSRPGNLNPLPVAAANPQINRRLPFAYRLSNTAKSPGTLARQSKALLLENAMLETDGKVTVSIPDHLRAQGDPGAYIVQSAAPLDNSFRAMLQKAGASIVSYIPNNAYLVRAPAAAAGELAASPRTQSVLPYEPYYKLKSSLLGLAVEKKPLPANTELRVLVFEDALSQTLEALKNMGQPVTAQERSPFGPALTVRPDPTALSTMAGLPGVQEIEPAHPRVLANDLSRAQIGVAVDSVVPTNYLNLTGTNILVNLNDSGVDTNHPDFSQRLLFDFPGSGGDADGHGTHVAGIIAGNGSKSTTISNAIGSIMPPVDGQFRGKAPAAKLFSMLFTDPDSYLQETAARTNAFISNNSWQYLNARDYDIAASSYDAAVRDSLPGKTGSQPMVYVFPAGNAGSLRLFDPLNPPPNNDGLGGDADTIPSPGTAKNVITVGAIELARNVTNEIIVCFPDAAATNGITCFTNLQVWRPSTDGSNQVAGFSSRGNVGIGLEGDFGRFKPDVVAPGTFVVSTRSQQWDQSAYYSPTNYSASFRPELIVNPHDVFVNKVDTYGVLQVRVQIINPDPPYNLPFYVDGAIVATNVLRVPPDAPLSPSGLNYAISNVANEAVTFGLQTIVVTTNNYGNYFTVLSNMNNDLGQFYRYESGTSMAAADVSGMLALMQEFFEQGLKITNSPAMMKALVINGARSVGDLYDFQVQTLINYQGWGLVNLPTSLPGVLSNIVNSSKTSSMFIFDQSRTNALATGQRHTRLFSQDVEARGGADLRVTLVWTDPPGNPLAAVKLVNDLDLIVTNLDSGEVYFGNNMPSGSDYTDVWNTNQPPTFDVINNVENVYFKRPNMTNFSVTVVGRHVNVNAVTAHTNDTVQDYALVVSYGNGSPTNALTLTEDRPTLSAIVHDYTIITNMFPESEESPTTGGLLLHQHVGANTPLLGTNTVPWNVANGVITLGLTNQWHFYSLSNEMDFTNAAFVTFMPPNLAVPRMGVDQFQPEDASRPEADIDLYVSTDPTLTNLNPIAIAGAYRSLGRGGTELIVLTNAEPKTVYYVGVKSEDHMAAEYGFFGIFSLEPFSSKDEHGNIIMRGLPTPSVIPAGTPPKPQAAQIFGISIDPVPVRRVVVTNWMSHEQPGTLIGILNHNRKFATLNNHTCVPDPGGICYTNYVYVYEDNGEGDLPGSLRSDGPGSLKDFIGEEGVGLWMLTEVGNLPSATGVVNSVRIKLEPSNVDPNNAATRALLPDTFTYDFIDVPPEATNLTVCVTGNDLPVELYVSKDQVPDRDNYDYRRDIIPPGGCLSISPFDLRPLTPGRYFIGVYNPNQTVQYVRVTATVTISPSSVSTRLSTGAATIPIADDAVTYAYLFNRSHMMVSSLDIGLLIDHPRISDLAITLISPKGTRIVLFENRGATSTTGLGTFSSGTNAFYTTLEPVYTNDFDLAPFGIYTPGALFQGWSVLSNSINISPDYSVPWVQNHLLVLGDGVVSGILPITPGDTSQLQFKVTHAPYLVGMVGWWPLDEDGRDIWGGFDGLVSGDPAFPRVDGKVNRAMFDDGVRGRVLIPKVPELNVGLGRGFTIEGWINPTNVSVAVPLAEWNDPTNVAPGLEFSPLTNTVPQGVQFWLSGSSWTNPLPGALTAVLWDTSSNAFVLNSPLGAITNNGWQHVAFTYDTTNREARIYSNGRLAAAQAFPQAGLPRTTGNLYLGFHPDDITNVISFKGGLDEFSLYSRALSDCEIAAICSAGSAGKYGTNALVCPVALQVAVDGSIYYFTNGLSWTNGPTWETDSIDLPAIVSTNGSGTNPVSIVFTPLDPNVAMDDFVLSKYVTNTLNGLLHFNENTNLSLVPIKFAPAPYAMSNFPPTLIFSNNFENATRRDYATGETIPGTRDWTVSQGPVTVIHNPLSDAVGSHSLILARGSVQTAISTVPGHRYRIDYALQGPGAVSWWAGDVDPLSGRALDVISGNDGAFFFGATNVAGVESFISESGLFFSGLVNSNTQTSSKIELGDPANLRLTNGLTIEGWVRPIPQPDDSIRLGIPQQILFRGDSRFCRDPYWFAIEQVTASTFDLVFHVEDAGKGNCGVALETQDAPLVMDRWQHIAAVFASNVPVTNNAAGFTNELRLYLNGQRLTNTFMEIPSGVGQFATTYTGELPSGDLDPTWSPGISIGNRSRLDFSEPFRGYLDELTVYGRSLTDAEILAIAGATNSNGKADSVVPPNLSLSKVGVYTDNTLRDVGYGDNTQSSSYSFDFLADRTNTVLSFVGQLPGSVLQNFTVTELPLELNYLPEQSLASLNGEDAYGIWALEIWDTRAGAAVNANLVQWQLDFRLVPRSLQPPISLSHGIPYVGTLPAGGYQDFIVPVPQWALWATNILEYATNRLNGNQYPVGLLFDQDQPTPLTSDNALVWPPALSGNALLGTNTQPQFIVPGQAYYLTVTNPNYVPVTFVMDVWFDITPLTNCQAATNYVGPAGVPRYFQFDVPAEQLPPGANAQQVSFWLSSAESNVTVVLSQHLPLPDLGHYDYISRQPSTNNEIIMLVTNTTPFPIQSNRWYVGVFNSTAANVPFIVQACYLTNDLVIIPLANGVPFTASISNWFVAPPGPPRSFFFEYDQTNYVDAILFELYGLSGDADLVLQRDTPPTMAPYLDGSFRLGTTHEQIVRRVSSEMGDLRGKWFLGLYNNEATNVAYTIRVATPKNGMLSSAMPLSLIVTPAAGPHGVTLSWYSVDGEIYAVEVTRQLFPPKWQLLMPNPILATTPFSAYELPLDVTGMGFFRIRQVPRSEVLQAPLTVTYLPNGIVRISWPTTFVGYTLQYNLGLGGAWANAGLAVTVEGNEYVVYDTPGGELRYYRLIP